MNDIANLCERVGANVDMVRRGIGTDERIGPAFLFPGPGYGGSCFPKDVKALVKTARDCSAELSILESVEAVNERQKRKLFEKLHHALGASLSIDSAAGTGTVVTVELDIGAQRPEKG